MMVEAHQDDHAMSERHWKQEHEEVGQLDLIAWRLSAVQLFTCCVLDWNLPHLRVLCIEDKFGAVWNLLISRSNQFAGSETAEHAAVLLCEVHLWSEHLAIVAG